MSDIWKDPCAGCDHPRGDHHHYPGANLNPGHWGECEADGCVCRLFVRDCTPEEAEKAADNVWDRIIGISTAAGGPDFELAPVGDEPG